MPDIIISHYVGLCNKNLHIFLYPVRPDIMTLAQYVERGERSRQRLSFVRIFCRNVRIFSVFRTLGVARCIVRKRKIFEHSGTIQVIDFKAMFLLYVMFGDF